MTRAATAMLAALVFAGCAAPLTPIPTYWDPVLHLSIDDADAWPDLTPKPPAPERPSGYRRTLDAFGDIAEQTGGALYPSLQAGQTPPLLGDAMQTGVAAGASIDIALVVDTTASMYDEIVHVREALGDLVDDLSRNNPDWRLALVEYRDRQDDFAARVAVPLTDSKRKIVAGISELRVRGGGDYCEHVHAGLGVALDDVAWRPNAQRRIILIGDAPPHEDPSWVPDRPSVIRVAKERNIRVFAIGTHCGTACEAAAPDGC